MGLDTGVKRLKKIDNDYMYWRKANHIHKWFVDNFQDGNDDCRYVVITEWDKEKLEELLDKCNKVIKSLEKQKLEEVTIDRGIGEYGIYKSKQYTDISVAEELLPTTDGFFFGGIEYGEYYLEDTKLTRKWLKKALKEVDFENGEVLLYWSSW